MTQSPILFCPKCFSYFPSGAVCVYCGHRRPVIEIPPVLGDPFWKAEMPGSVAGQISPTHLDAQAVLVVPWSHQPRRGDGRPPDGGVSLIRLADGGCLWSQQFGMPVEGGVGLTDEVVVAGMGTRGIGAGIGWVVALSLQNGEERWRVQLGGAVRCAPLVESVRVYVPASDGLLYCLDVRNGREVWRAALSMGEVQVPASPVIVKERGVLQAILVSTYGRMQRLDEGRIIAFDMHGRRLWEQDAGGNVRGTPVVAGGRIYVPAFRSNPPAGVLSVFDSRAGSSLWLQPFMIQGQPGERRTVNFSASPLVHEGRVYLGSLNGRFYALEADSGDMVWESDIAAGIASAPAWSEGLVIFGANDGKIYALDGDTGQKAWEFSLEAPVLTGLQDLDGIVLAGASNGALAALPWHLGRYEWAAERLEKASRYLEAGDCRALAAHFSLQLQTQMKTYQMAEEDWSQAGALERAARLWLGLDRRDLAAETFKAAGYRWRMHDRERAARHFWEAANFYFSLRNRDALNECTRALATCAQLPFIKLQAVNIGTFIQWEQGEFTLRLGNEGNAPVVGGVRLRLGGALKSAVEAEIRSPLESGKDWNISLNVIPTRRESNLEVEVEYDPGVPEFAPLRGMLAIPIEAVEPRQNVVIGDVGMLQLTIASSTQEGLAIVTRDVGAMRSQGDIGTLKTTGDVGAISAGGEIGSIQTGGDVGLVKRNT